MPVYEYKVVPAPRRGLKSRGVKGAEAMFANALATQMNELGADGWEYLRADTLPCEERQGLTGKTTVFQNMLVFRRTVETAVAAAHRTTPVETEVAASPEPPMPIAAPTEGRAPVAAPERIAETLVRPAPSLGPAQGPATRRTDADETTRHAAE